MDVIEAFNDLMIESDLVSHSFRLRSENFDASASSELVAWLTDEFTLRRCTYLATAVARRIGREHHVSFVHPDGRLAHAVVAVSPQYDGVLRGDGIDILGRRSLSQTAATLADITETVLSVEIGDLVAEDEYAAGEEASLAELAAMLPWYSGALRKPALVPDGPAIERMALVLGMRPRAETSSQRRL